MSSSVFAKNNSNLYHKSNCPELGAEGLIEFASSQKARESGGDLVTIVIRNLRIIKKVTVLDWQNELRYNFLLPDYALNIHSISSFINGSSNLRFKKLLQNNFKRSNYCFS